MITRTAEVVSPKHPDKLCDRVSDAILDLFLEKDPVFLLLFQPSCLIKEAIMLPSSLSQNEQADPVTFLFGL